MLNLFCIRSQTFRTKLQFRCCLLFLFKTDYSTEKPPVCFRKYNRHCCIRGRKTTWILQPRFSILSGSRYLNYWTIQSFQKRNASLTPLIHASSGRSGADRKTLHGHNRVRRLHFSFSQQLLLRFNFTQRICIKSRYFQALFV